MAGKAKVLCLNGEYWFSQAYAAELLGTTRAKIKTMIVRELVRCHPLVGDDYVSEKDINRIRQSPEELKALKKKVHEPQAMRPPVIGSAHKTGPDQNVLPISDHRLPLDRRMKFKD